MNEHISDVPLAVLLPLNGESFTWALTQLPPPPEILIPRTASYMAAVSKMTDDVSHLKSDHRRFKLDIMLRSPACRWWNVYNEGRSRTPEDGFVYREVKVKP